MSQLNTIRGSMHSHMFKNKSRTTQMLQLCVKITRKAEPHRGDPFLLVMAATSLLKPRGP